MMWTPIWSNPIGWSEQIAKTKLRLFLWSILHLSLLGLGLWAVQHEGVGRRFGVYFILIMGAWYPCLYLYAMHRLLRSIAERTASRTHDD